MPKLGHNSRNSTRVWASKPPWPDMPQSTSVNVPHTLLYLTQTDNDLRN